MGTSTPPSARRRWDLGEHAPPGPPRPADQASEAKQFSLVLPIVVHGNREGIPDQLVQVHRDDPDQTRLQMKGPPPPKPGFAAFEMMPFSSRAASSPLLMRAYVHSKERPRRSLTWAGD